MSTCLFWTRRNSLGQTLPLLRIGLSGLSGLPLRRPTSSRPDWTVAEADPAIEEVPEGRISQLPTDVYQFLNELHRTEKASFDKVLEKYPDLKQVLVEKNRGFDDGEESFPISQISTSDFHYLSDPRLSATRTGDWVSLAYSEEKGLLYLQGLKEERLLTLEVSAKVKYLGWSHHGMPGPLL